MNLEENHSSSFVTIIDGYHDSCHRYYQNVFRYKHEVSEQQSAQVELLIDIINPKVRFNKGLKPRLSYRIRIRLTNSEKRYKTRLLLTETITNLGMEFSAFDKQLRIYRGGGDGMLIQFSKFEPIKFFMEGFEWGISISILRHPYFHSQNILFS
jgi:hypothetical protein